MLVKNFRLNSDRKSKPWRFMKWLRRGSRPESKFREEYRLTSSILYYIIHVYKYYVDMYRCVLHGIILKYVSFKIHLFNLLCDKIFTTFWECFSITWCLVKKKIIIIIMVKKTFICEFQACPSPPAYCRWRRLTCIRRNRILFH